MGSNPAQTHFTTCIILGVITILLPVARYFLQRQSGARKHRATSARLSEALFVLSALLGTANLVLICVKAKAESTARAENESLLMVMAIMLAPKWLRLTWVLALTYCTELWVLKAAFLSLFWGIFARVQSRMIYTLYAAIAVTVLTYIAGIALIVGWCRPVHNNWTSDLLLYQQCAIFASPTPLMIGSILNISTDLIIILLPLLVIQQLHLRTLAEKLALSSVFLLGSSSIICSGIRYALVRNSLSNGKTPTLDDIRRIEVFTAVEFTCALFAFCLPALRLHFLRVVGKVRGYVSGPEMKSGGYSGQRSSNLEGMRRPKVLADEGIVGEEDGVVGGRETVDLELRDASTRNSREAEGLHPVQEPRPW